MAIRDLSHGTSCLLQSNLIRFRNRQVTKRGRLSDVSRPTADRPPAGKTTARMKRRTASAVREEKIHKKNQALTEMSPLHIALPETPRDLL